MKGRRRVGKQSLEEGGKAREKEDRGEEEGKGKEGRGRGGEGREGREGGEGGKGRRGGMRGREGREGEGRKRQERGWDSRQPTLAVLLSTTFLVVRSLLLPTSSLLTFSLA